MKIIEEPVTLETVTKYKDELFLFNEEMEYLQDKRIIKLIDDNGQLIAISMYTDKMEKQDIELYLSADTQRKLHYSIIEKINQLNELIKII